MTEITLWVGYVATLLVATAILLMAISYAYEKWYSVRQEILGRAVDHRLRARASMMRASVYWFDNREDWAALWASVADAMAMGAYPDVQTARDAARAADARQKKGSEG